MSEPVYTNLLLIGFMGSGKSSVGRLLATQLGFQFVDTDALVVQAMGMPITEIFEVLGEDGFRESESQALDSLRGRHRLVVATGGGIVTREGNIATMHDLGFVVALTATEEVIFERVSRNTKRPLLQTANPRQTLSELLGKRAPLYARAAHFEVDTSMKSHAEVAREIIAEVRHRFPEGR